MAHRVAGLPRCLEAVVDCRFRHFGTQGAGSHVFAALSGIAPRPVPLFPGHGVRMVRGRTELVPLVAACGARGFCATCGSTVAMREEVLGDRVQICVGNLDEPHGIHIDDHVWTQERISWFEIRDGLPRFLQSSTAVPSKALQP